MFNQKTNLTCLRIVTAFNPWGIFILFPSCKLSFWNTASFPTYFFLSSWRLWHHSEVWAKVDQLPIDSSLASREKKKSIEPISSSIFWENSRIISQSSDGWHLMDKMPLVSIVSFRTGSTQHLSNQFSLKEYTSPPQKKFVLFKELKNISLK